MKSYLIIALFLAAPLANAYMPADQDPMNRMHGEGFLNFSYSEMMPPQTSNEPVCVDCELTKHGDPTRNPDDATAYRAGAPVKGQPIDGDR